MNARGTVVSISILVAVGAVAGDAARRHEIPGEARGRDTAGAVGALASPLGATALDALDWPDLIALERALAETDADHQPRSERGVPMLGDAARFSGAGASVAVDHGAGEVTIGLAAIGRPGAMRTVSTDAAATISGPEVRIARAPGIVEWWRSLPSGLEQGVTIDERPPGDGPLVLEMTVGGGIRAERVSDDEIALRDAGGVLVATYTGLVVQAADGSAVAARLAVVAGRISIEVTDASAAYPIVVDPLLIAEEATVASGVTDPVGSGSGSSVAISADGMRVVVGEARYSDPEYYMGRARIYRRSGAAWVLEGEFFGAPGSYFGVSVAISASGAWVAVGAPSWYSPGGIIGGRVSTFARSGTTWTEGPPLGRAVSSSDEFGSSVAWVADGSNPGLAVGIPRARTSAGAEAGLVLVVELSFDPGLCGAIPCWTSSAPVLTAPDGAPYDHFGAQLASGGGTLAVVASGDYVPLLLGNFGTARIHVQSGSAAAWVQTAVIAAPDSTAQTVAVSPDGTRAIVGGSSGASVFVRTTPSTWALEASLAAPSATTAWRVALGVDRALVGWPLLRTTAGEIGAVGVFMRSGTVWSREATITASGAAPFDGFGSAVSLTPDGSRAIVGVPGDDTSAGADTGSARIFTITPAPNGTACTTAAGCASGLCTDGVCCATACSGGSSDCQACSVTAGGTADGTCTPLSASVATTVTCRASAGTCDPAEACVATSPTCPTDALAPAAMTCRAATGVCDAAEACDGASAACPADGPLVGGTVCRSAAAGATCDREEVCDGISIACPPDTVRPAGTECRGSGGVCDVIEVCDGVSAMCPMDGFRAGGAPCAGAVTGLCDSLDVCSGGSPACPDLFRPAGTPCGPAPTGEACDAPDECTGASGECLPSFLSGVECRASTGACDPAEVCLGDATTCPPDQILPASVSCRVSIDSSCDPAESCDGVATSCPADVNTCVARPDSGGVDAGRAAGDAGGPPLAAAGCACRAQTRGGPLGAGGAGLALLALAVSCARRRSRVRASVGTTPPSP